MEHVFYGFMQGNHFPPDQVPIGCAVKQGHHSGMHGFICALYDPANGRTHHPLFSAEGHLLMGVAGHTPGILLPRHTERTIDLFQEVDPENKGLLVTQVGFNKFHLVCPGFQSGDLHIQVVKAVATTKGRCLMLPDQYGVVLKLNGAIQIARTAIESRIDVSYGQHIPGWVKCVFYAGQVIGNLDGLRTFQEVFTAGVMHQPACNTRIGFVFFMAANE
jgi:hypothetical protein